MLYSLILFIYLFFHSFIIFVLLYVYVYTGMFKVTGVYTGVYQVKIIVFASTLGSKALSYSDSSKSEKNIIYLNLEI